MTKPFAKHATILVVEDDPRIQRLVDMVLSAEGYRILQAGDGRQALELLKTEKPDAILLDLMLPVLDGWQLRTQLLANPHTAHIPVVLMSAVHDISQTARELQASAYLPKPFSIDDLLTTVRNQTPNF